MRTKLVWLIQFVNGAGETFYVKKTSSIYFKYVSDQDSATQFTNKPAADDFASSVKIVNRNPDKVTVVAITV